MSTAFGNRLREIRKRGGHTTVSAAKALCVSQPTYNTWELGTREPNIEKLLAICQLLNTSPNELLGFEAPSAPGTAVTTGANSPIISGNGNSVTIGAPGSPGTARPTRKRK